MAENPAVDPYILYLKRQKVKLIEILSADPDFVLQHADSRCLLPRHIYQQVKSCRVPSEKVTDLLDHIIQRGPEAAKELLNILKEPALQKTYPALSFIKDQQITTSPSGSEEMSTKRKGAQEIQDLIPAKSERNDRSVLVNEKQLMFVARKIGRSWREIGRLALDISSVKLEQIELDHSIHVERVFAMLQYWRKCQKKKATAAHLHSLLCQDDWALPPEDIDFLLESD